MDISGQVVDVTKYHDAVAKMKPGAAWPKSFIARGANRYKKKDLLCVVISMPEWYNILGAYSLLERQNANLVAEVTKLKKQLAAVKKAVT